MPSGPGRCPGGRAGEALIRVRFTARGLASAEVAGELFISPGTVETRLGSVQAGLGNPTRRSRHPYGP